MPGFTHMQTAQPITFGHHLLAYVEMLSRDKSRFIDCNKRLNENPLGSGALSGTSFPINRKITTKSLGFNKPMQNSLDAVSSRDFVLETISSITICSINLSRLAEEIVMWMSGGFNFIDLPDNLTTGSSIMPQKKNPDLLEYLRGKSGNSFGNLFSMLTILKGLPLSYFKDLQDDKELVFKTNKILQNCISILNEVLNNFSPNKKKMLELAETGYITATDLADFLVKNHKMSFRKAYEITASIVNLAEKKKKKLHELDLNDLKKIEPMLTSDVIKVFDLKYSVNSKKSFGGTSFANIKKMITKYKKE